MAAGDIISIVIGVALSAASRTIADAFRIPGNRSTAVKMLGMADDDVSRLYGWFVCVLGGLVLISAGLVNLLSR